MIHFGSHNGKSQVKGLLKRAFSFAQNCMALYPRLIVNLYIILATKNTHYLLVIYNIYVNN